MQDLLCFARNYLSRQAGGNGFRTDTVTVALSRYVHHDTIVVIFMLTSPRQDGGGVRGYTSLLILKEIFKAVEVEAGRKVMPCELFDLIGGTSTGG